MSDIFSTPLNSNSHVDYVVNLLKYSNNSTLSISSNISGGEKLLNITFFVHEDDWTSLQYMSYCNYHYAYPGRTKQKTTWYNFILSRKINPQPYDIKAYGWISGVSIEGYQNVNSAIRIEADYKRIAELGMELETILDMPTIEWDKVGFFD